MVTKDIVRKCVVCGVKHDRNVLIRVLQDYRSGAYVVNPGKKEFGRSIYLCNNAECVAKFEKHKKYKDKIDFDLLTQITSQTKTNGNRRQN